VEWPCLFAHRQCPQCRLLVGFVAHSDRHGFPTTAAFKTLQFRMPCNCRQIPNEAHRLTAFGASREEFEHDPKYSVGRLSSNSGILRSGNLLILKERLLHTAATTGHAVDPLIRLAKALVAIEVHFVPSNPNPMTRGNMRANGVRVVCAEVFNFEQTRTACRGELCLTKIKEAGALF
jgi:hypothetical protein